MKQASTGYIIDTVSRTNVLPIISECNTRCIFCSHRYNPSNIEVFRLPALSCADFQEIIPYLSGDSKIIIGESATRIIEGEPMLHPEFPKILGEVRRRFPSATIQVTTNGTLLNKSVVDFFTSLGKVELNISVNCIRPVSRKNILGRPVTEDYVSLIQLLNGKLRFSGSIVAVPGVLDRDEIRETIELLETNGADMVRIFVPGYTRTANEGADFMSLYNETASIAAEIKTNCSVPVIVEPAPISDLLPMIEGVIHNTPSAGNGLLKGDIIHAVNGVRPVSRVDAFNRVYHSSDPVITINRSGKISNLNLRKSRNTSPGFIMLYDADPLITGDVERAARRNGASSVLIITSELAEDVIKQLFNTVYTGPIINILPVQNRFFGGTIKCAGLLTVDDIVSAVKNKLAMEDRPDLILVPPVMFDYRGRDLSGKHFSEIGKELGVTVDIP